MSSVQNLKTVVTLGGAVDNSFSSMAGTVDKELGSATKKVKSLEREQTKLTKQIKKAKLAGADVSLLTKRYQELDRDLEKATRSAEDFSAASNAIDGLKNGAKYAAATATAVAGLSATVMGLVTVTNAQTAEQAGLAKAYGMTIEQFSAWGGVAQQAGLNAENTGDLVEELTNKFGEFKALGEQSSVSDVFGALGIDEAMMDGLSAAEQFEMVMRRLQKVGDSQQAASLADMLFGGEGNKIVTYIKNSGKSLDDLLDQQKRINNLTQEGADGASRYNTAWNSVVTALGSAWQDVAGIVGGEVAPIFDELAITVSSFVRDNKTEIVGFLKSAVEGSIAFAGSVIELASSVNTVVQSIGGWESVLYGVAAFMTGKAILGVFSLVSGIGTMVKTLTLARTAMIGLNLVMSANPLGLVIKAVAALVTGLTALYGAFNLFGDDEEEKEPPKEVKTTGYASYTTGNTPQYNYGYNSSYAARAQAIDSNVEAAAGGSSPTVHQNVEKIEVVAAPGQSPEEIGRAVAAELSGQQTAMFDLSGGD